MTARGARVAMRTNPFSHKASAVIASCPVGTVRLSRFPNGAGCSKSDERSVGDSLINRILE